MNRRARSSCPVPHGFTLIELLVVIVVLALIATLAAPSFTRLLAKKRVEGVTSELVTDLQYARSEAVQRNEIVRVAFGTGCYVIHTEGVGVASSCSQSSPSSIGPGSKEIKTVQLPYSSTVSFSPNAGLVFFQFQPPQGTAMTSGSVNVNSTSGEWQLRAIVSPVGRVRTCSPNSSVTGYSNECSS